MNVSRRTIGLWIVRGLAGWVVVGAFVLAAILLVRAI